MQKIIEVGQVKEFNKDPNASKWLTPRMLELAKKGQVKKND